MTDEKREKLKAYVMAASINNPLKTKAWLEHLATLPEEEQEEEIDRAIIERGLERMALKSDGIGNVGNFKKFGVMVAEARRKASEDEHE